jgi:hypothetical protein
MSSRELVVAALISLAACGSVTALPDAAVPDGAAPDGAPRDAAPVDAIACSTTPIEVLPNGSFDSATPAWIQDPSDPALLCGQPTIMPASLPSAGCLGSIDGTIQALTQTVALPRGATSLTLTGQICIATADTAAADHDLLQVDLLDGGNVIAALGKRTNRDGVADCQFGAFELTATLASAPATATLRLRSTLDASLTTTFYLDNLSLKVGCAK